MSDNIILLQGWKAPEIQIGKEVMGTQIDLLTKTESIKEIGTTEQQNSAVEIVREIKGITKSVESARKEVKAPFLDLGKQIDKAAEDFTSPLLEEAKRIEKLLFDFQKKIDDEAQKIREEAERKQREEQAKIEQERRDALAKATSEAERIRAEENAAEKERSATVESLKLQSSLATIALSKPAGLAKKRTAQFEVNDIIELFKARPDLVSFEPRTREINSQILGGMKECPGLKIWIEESTTVRS